MTIIFRRSHRRNLFRDLVIASLSIPRITEVLICSGFFQEAFKGSAYRVSQERNLAGALARSGAKVITVGVHNASWLQAYRDFVASLRTTGVNVIARRAPQFHWHAKVFILSTKTGPVFGAVGSSNMTRNAFGVTQPFNYEADVIMWVPRFNKAF